jgi:tRNA(Arg) A34 adenosine deaminase TadA
VTEHTDHLTRAVELAALARAGGNDPFGALLVTSDGRIVEAQNSVVTGSDPTGHAETNLVRLAAAQISSDELASSTLYTSTEPCAMCCGAIFWGGIPRVVYALAESELNAMLPAGSIGLVLDLPSREVFARGGHATEVVGPIETPGMREVHAGYWG